MREIPIYAAGYIDFDYVSREILAFTIGFADVIMQDDFGKIEESGVLFFSLYGFLVLYTYNSVANHVDLISCAVYRDLLSTQITVIH